VNEHEVTFDSGDCLLAGTYTEAAEPVGAALLITGSGRTDRNSDARLPLGLTLRLAVTRSLAAALAAANVSSLRFDKRGVGASGGDYLTTGMAQQLDDARAALRWLAAKAPGVPVTVIGHSEGTYYAVQLAGDAGVAGVVLLAGPARSGGEILAWQTRQLASRLPRITRLILRLMRTDLVRAQRKAQDRIEASADDVIRIRGTRVNARWFRDFIGYDPRPALEQVTVPLLAITGGHDLQVPPGDVAVMGDLVAGPFEGHVVGDLSHILRPDPDSVGPRGYRRAVRTPVPPEVLGLVTDWVTRRGASS
jgi:pimeloyl-ACP methyl ester carboxylesterase